jgi:dipeptidyl aminopeptidase/acylaminoacyl peptidase
MLSEPSFSPDGKKVAFSVKRANVKDDSYESDVYLADVKSGEPSVFTSGKKDSDPKWSPDGASIMFVSRRGLGKDDKGNALYVIPAGGGEAKLLYRAETGVENPQWAPGSKEVLFTTGVAKKDKDDVRVIRRITFWFNGLGFTYGVRRHLFRIDTAGGKPVQLTRGAFNVGDFAVSHDGRRVAYLASTSDLKPFISDLYLMDLSSRRTKKLTKSNMELGTLAWSPDDSRVVVAGDDLPAGFASHTRLWIVDLKSRAMALAEKIDRNKANSLNSDARAKAHGPFSVVWDTDGIYFLQADGGSVHVYRMAPGKNPELVIGGNRSVEGFDVRGGKVAFVSMDSSHLEELYVRDGRETALTSLNSKVYDEVDVLPSERVSYRASDGAAVEGWVLLPRSKGKVPGILYVHGGPKTAFGYSYMHEFQAFGGAGYAVIYLNPRGSDGYTEKFADIRRNYGTRDFQDLMEGLDHVLKTYPQIDGARIGIAGGSYGGFMTNWAVGHTDRFRAAVTDRSIASWASMWGVSDIGPWFTDDQMGGDLWESPDKVRSDSPITYAPKVNTPLLIVHSMEDYRCPMVEGIQFFTALKRMGKEAELVLFPGENHDLSRVGKPKHRVARLNHYIRWFDAHLKKRR